MASIEELLRKSPLYRSLSREDLQRLASVAISKSYEKGAWVFGEGDSSDFLFTIATGRVKVVKALPSGKEVILEIFGPGDPVGAVVAYEGRPYPASAIATEPTTCILVRREAFFALLENHPSFVRGFLVGLAQRIVELTRRIPEVTGGRVETRFAHLFLKLADRMGRPERGGRFIPMPLSRQELADRMGRPERGGRFIPMPLSRQELADLAGTTIETSIRIMSRWGKEGIVETEKDGFLLRNREELERLALA